MAIQVGAIPGIPIDQQSCSNCVAFRNGSECHFNPPAMILQAPMGGDPVAKPRPYWPQVSASDWCYRWELAL